MSGFIRFIGTAGTAVLLIMGTIVILTAIGLLGAAVVAIVT